jgi:hypothetical protein
MKHFGLEEWADFVRGAGDERVRAGMAEHLNAGCSRCAQAADVLGRAARIMAGESQYQVPEHAIRHAKAFFSLQRPEARRFPRIRALLVFDSALEPLPAGIRSQDRLTRRALYAAGPFLLDLRFEQDPESPMLSLVGQLANRGDAPAEPAGHPVLLAAGNEVVARTVTNRFGEFQIEYEPVPRLRLCLPLDPATGRIELPLSRLTSDTIRAQKGGKTSRSTARRSNPGKAKPRKRE